MNDRIVTIESAKSKTDDLLNLKRNECRDLEGSYEVTSYELSEANQKIRVLEYQAANFEKTVSNQALEVAEQKVTIQRLEKEKNDYVQRAFASSMRSPSKQKGQHNISVEYLSGGLNFGSPSPFNMSRSNGSSSNVDNSLN